MSNPLVVYHYPVCGTCRKAIKSLEALGQTLELHNIKESPPSASELTKLIAASGLPIAKWFNTSGDVYRSLGLKDKLPALSDQEKIALLASNGMLIKRPIVFDGRQSTIGYKEEEYQRVYAK